MKRMEAYFQGCDLEGNLSYARVELKTTEPKFIDQDLSLGMENSGVGWKTVVSLEEKLLTNVRVWRLGNVYQGITLVRISSSCELYPSNIKILITNRVFDGRLESYKVTSSLAEPFQLGICTDLQRDKRLVVYEYLGYKIGTKGANLDSHAREDGYFPVGMWCDTSQIRKLSHEEMIETFDNPERTDIVLLPEAIKNLALRLYSHDS